ncbi:uncharacterized protein LOC131687426 [Topomyia yanbarensis]|uniref:uncharacterized protein LOC131687426 n=1 Tax=Topomyia yanbarensis TaxID=2498891 RepID=UPI00273BFFA5|nr:uncharacterized protein LOC131687426 [Topomyia yanbarensis]
MSDPRNEKTNATEGAVVETIGAPMATNSVNTSTSAGAAGIANSVPTRSPQARPTNSEGDIPSAEQHSCCTCKSVHNSRMVQCDDCDDWHHFACVGVTQMIEHDDWICLKCTTAKTVRTNDRARRGIQQRIRSKSASHGRQI